MDLVKFEEKEYNYQEEDFYTFRIVHFYMFTSCKLSIIPGYNMLMNMERNEDGAKNYF